MSMLVAQALALWRGERLGRKCQLDHTLCFHHAAFSPRPGLCPAGCISPQVLPQLRVSVDLKVLVIR